MAKRFDEMSEALIRFVRRQRIFFAASAGPETRVNVSPRDTRALRVVDARTVIWLDMVGSGSETAAHLRADGRLTLMFCAFEGPPMILRLYGRGASLVRGTPEYEALLAAHYDGQAPVNARQIVRLDADLVQTSCGYSVPLFSFDENRTVLDEWAERKGAQGIDDYIATRNETSMDGLPTGLR